MFDAIPEIVMRLSRHALGAEARGKPRKTISGALHHLSLPGAILWFLAEISDLPILAMIRLHWIRVDEEEAKRIDALLDAQEE
jgi:putative membrane protein